MTLVAVQFHHEDSLRGVFVVVAEIRVLVKIHARVLLGVSTEVRLASEGDYFER